MNELKPKQKKFIDAFRSGKFRYLMAAGTAGSGKSIVELGILHLLCANIRGLRFAVLRKSDRNLKQTSIPTYRKTKEISKSSNDSFIAGMTARYYATGSEIIFIWADITKDPELDNVKGLELTGALIEEANQIDLKYFNMLKTRIGRWGSDRCKPFILLNMNPSIGWCKDLFYDPWLSGTLPENMYFEEFDVHDVERLIKAGDIEKEFLETMNDLPDEEKSRYIYNSWNYSDVPNQLIKYEWYKNCCVAEPLIRPTDRAIMAIDPAWDGADATGFARMHGNHIGWWEEYPTQDPGQTGLLGIARAQEFGVKPDDVSIDSIGLGAGTVFTMRNNKPPFFPHLFIAGESPVLNLSYLKTANLRAEAHWLLREGLRKEEITITHHPKAQKHLLAAQYDVSDKVIKIEDKKLIKKRIHESPTMLDLSAMLAHRFYTTAGDLQKKIADRQLSQIAERATMSRAQRERLEIIRGSLAGV